MKLLNKIFFKTKATSPIVNTLKTSAENLSKTAEESRFRLDPESRIITPHCDEFITIKN